MVRIVNDPVADESVAAQHFGCERQRDRDRPPTGSRERVTPHAQVPEQGAGGSRRPGSDPNSNLLSWHSGAPARSAGRVRLHDHLAFDDDGLRQLELHHPALDPIRRELICLLHIRFDVVDADARDLHVGGLHQRV